jgi:hypothetical protein
MVFKIAPTCQSGVCRGTIAHVLPRCCGCSWRLMATCAATHSGGRSSPTCSPQHRCGLQQTQGKLRVAMKGVLRSQASAGRCWTHVHNIPKKCIAVVAAECSFMTDRCPDPAQHGPCLHVLLVFSAIAIFSTHPIHISAAPAGHQSPDSQPGGCAQDRPHSQRGGAACYRMQGRVQAAA